ncbi:MAG TPA: aldo/keto reductase [Limnochordia bacterium]|nr:aldo/keto reductase [Limnochordia bacterium]
MGNTKEEVSLLGFGCMRLPTREDGEIDEAEAIALIRYAIDHGVNYLDTAYGYHNGQSEVLVGKAVRDGYREKVKIATKLPVWLVKEPGDCPRLFNEQLERLGVERVDFYLLHALNHSSWQQALEHEALEFLEQMQLEGRIGYVGFSFHDDLQVFREIIDAYPWDFCQIQFNYMDECHQAGLAGLKYAASKGLGVVIMEPLRGGRLVKNLPPEVEQLFQSAPIQRTPAEWALRWVADHPEVSVILSGMSKMSDVEENIRVLAEAQPHSLSKKELGIIAQAREIYTQRIKVLCTDCRYCLPCPQGVEIPRIFRMYNEAHMYNTWQSEGKQYQNLAKNSKDASQCIACGSCEAACPQNLEIIDLLQMVHRAFASQG